MVWGHSGKVYQEDTAGNTLQTAADFGFEYLGAQTLPRYQGAATPTKYRMGIAGNKCETHSNGILGVADIEFMRIGTIPIQMIPAVIRLFTSFDTTGLTTTSRYFFGLAYPATEDERESDTGRMLGHTTTAVFRLYRNYLGRFNADGTAGNDTLKTTQKKDQDRMLTVWPNIENTNSKEYADWTLSRYSKSIKEVWETAKAQDGMFGEDFLPAYVDVVLNNVNGEPQWSINDFIQINCTFVDGG